MRNLLYFSLFALVINHAEAGEKRIPWAPDDSGWTFTEVNKSPYAAYQTELVYIGVSEFNGFLKTFQSVVTVQNKSTGEMTFYTHRLFLKDEIGTVSQAISSAQAAIASRKSFIGSAGDLGDAISSVSLDMETLPTGTNKAGYIHFDEGWVNMRKKQNFTLMIEGVYVDGQKIEIPPLQLVRKTKK